AAAAARARENDPDRVEARHGFAAFGLLLALAGLVAWLFWKRGTARERGDRQPGGTRRDNDAGSNLPPLTRTVTTEAKRGASSEHLGRLRSPLAIGFVGPALVLFGAFVIL